VVGEGWKKLRNKSTTRSVARHRECLWWVGVSLLTFVVVSRGVDGGIRCRVKPNERTLVEDNFLDCLRLA
jgi:hypothetical protein